MRRRQSVVVCAPNTTIEFREFSNFPKGIN